MTDEQKLKQLQALHRQQEQEMRQKLLERKQRTRRLCIIGGVVVNMFPSLKDIPTEALDNATRLLLTDEAK